MEEIGHLLANLPAAGAGEEFRDILSGDSFRVERIVSFGHASPEGFWYDQRANEWVLVLAGAGRLRFDDGRTVEMTPGTFVNIPAGRRHHVEWTQPGVATVWLAIHYSPSSG